MYVTVACIMKYIIIISIKFEYRLFVCLSVCLCVTKSVTGYYTPQYLSQIISDLQKISANFQIGFLS